jgi:hypothetical protein
MHSRETRFSKLGDPSVRVAVLDGYADLEHPCFKGANVGLLQGAAAAAGAADEMAAHGPQVASVLFGQRGSEVDGLMPNYSDFVIPIFSNQSRSVSQFGLCRAKAALSTNPGSSSAMSCMPQVCALTPRTGMPATSAPR